MVKTHDYTPLVLQLYDLGAVQFGNFKMASGLDSPIYIDLRRIIARPSLLKMAAEAYARLLSPLSFDHLAAVPYGALAIGTAVSLVMNRPLIFPRKEAKSYGTGRTIEGVFAEGDTAVIIEDLVTKGGSALKAIQALQTAGIVVSDVAVLIDREQGGRQALADAGYRLHAVLVLSEMLQILVNAGAIRAEEAAAVRAYLRSSP